MIVSLSVRKTVHAHEQVAFKCLGLYLRVKRKLGKIVIFCMYFKETYTYLSRFCLLKEKYLSVIYRYNDQNHPCNSFPDEFSCQNTFTINSF
jgi:hypothetical protein